MIDHTGVFIGRFQPFHNGHARVIDLALEQFPRVVIVIGSSFGPRTERNPFTFEERSNLIHSYISQKPGYVHGRVSIVGVPDHPSNDIQWLASIHSKVEELCQYDLPPALIGRKKDSSGYYLDLFPTWKSVPVFSKDDLDATTIRNLAYSKRFVEAAELVPEQCQSYLLHLFATTPFWEVIEEVKHNRELRKQYEGLKYEPVHVTVDAVVVRSGHVLMVTRGARPGKGLFALPGGFLDAKNDVSLRAAAERELYEETRIDVPRNKLRGHLVGSHVFDGMFRSSRGRTITHAFYYDLGFGVLPDIRGADDADDAKWMFISGLDGLSDRIFEDHLDIIKHFTRT